MRTSLHTIDTYVNATIESTRWKKETIENMLEIVKKKAGDSVSVEDLLYSYENYRNCLDFATYYAGWKNATLFIGFMHAVRLKIDGGR